MDKIKLRQICFYFAAVMPVAKMLVYPTALVYRARNGLLFSALLNFLAEGLIVLLVMLAAKRTGCSLFGLIRQKFGDAAARCVYGLFALFFLFSALLPLMEQKNFVLQVMYENTPSLISFAPFFFVSFYAAVKGFKSIGRLADIALPVFVFSFAALILLALPHADFSALLPLFAVPAKKLAAGSLFSINWYTDCAFLLFFLGHFKYEKGGAVKVLSAYAAGSAAVLLFLAVFYGIFSDIAVRQQNAIAQISKYTTSLSSLGRADYLFVFTLALIVIIRMCVPVQMCVHCASAAIGCKPFFPALAANALLLAAAVFFNYSYLEIQTLFTQKLWPLFFLFAYLVPAAALLLCGRKKHE